MNNKNSFGVMVLGLVIAAPLLMAQVVQPYVHHVRTALMGCREANVGNFFPNQQAPEIYGSNTATDLYYCELAVGPGELPISDLHHVSIALRDGSTGYNAVAALCFEKLGTGAKVCGAYDYTSGNSSTTQWMNVTPPEPLTGSDVVAYILVTVPGGSVFRGYTVYGD